MTDRANTQERHEALVGEALDALNGEAGAFLDAGMRNGLILYLADRVETGGFLRKVLENDFMESVCRAHPSLTSAYLRTLAQFVFTFLPSASWGSPAKVAAWLAAGKENA